MVVTLPLPPRVVQYFPQKMVEYLQWFAFWSFAGLLTIPWLFCVYQLVTKGLGRTKRIKHILDENSAPKTVIVMPVYKEEPEVLVTAIDSVVDCDYPPSCLHVFLSFDGDQEDELYLKTIEKLGVPLTLESYPKSIDVTYRKARITVSRFPHGGKRHCQKSTFKLIDKIYTEYLKRNDNLFILFIDSDCILDKVCIQNFMYEMVSRNEYILEPPRPQRDESRRRTRIPLSKMISIRRSVQANEFVLVGAQTRQQTKHVGDDGNHHFYHGEELLDHSIARHGIHTWTAVRAIGRIRLRFRDLPTRCAYHASILRFPKDGQILLCRQSGTV